MLPQPRQDITVKGFLSYALKMYKWVHRKTQAEDRPKELSCFPTFPKVKEYQMNYLKMKALFQCQAHKMKIDHPVATLMPFIPSHTE